jgi:hypothetical protein
MMGAQGQEQDDWKRNANQPKQDGAHELFVSFLPARRPTMAEGCELFRSTYWTSAAVAGSASFSRRPSIEARSMTAAA